MSALRIGVIGCGAIHATHCDAIRQIAGAELAAVMDVNADRARTAGHKYEVPWFTSLGPLLRRVDAVDVCTPSGTHASIGLRAARAGKHVVVEKPIDVSVRAAKRLVETCKELGLTLACISQHRFAATVRAARDVVQGGLLGRMLMGDAYVKWHRSQEYYDSGEWRGTHRLDGGCLMNQAIHYVDLLLWIMGPAASVRALTRTACHRMECEDVAVVMVEFASGAMGVIQASTCCYPGLPERLELHGERGTIVIEADRISRWDLEGVPTPSAQAQPSSTGAGDPTAIWGEQHRLQLQDFVRAVSERREPEVSGKNALDTLGFLDAAYRSARRGGMRVNLSPACSL